MDDYLLPDWAAIGILQEMDLIENHNTQIVDAGRSRVDHVAQNFGGHHDDWCLWVDAVIACHQANLLRAM